VQEPQPQREPASIGALLLRALHVLSAHWYVFLAVCIATVAAQSAATFLIHLPNMDLLAAAAIPPIACAIAFAYAGRDVLGNPLRVWPRVVERVWAVIVLDAMVYVFGSPLAKMDQNGFPALFLEVVGLLIALLTMYADVFATLESDVSTLMLLPTAIWRSIQLAASSRGWLWAIAFLFVEGVLTAVIGLLAPALAHVGLPDTAAWCIIIVSGFSAVPLSVLLAVVYMDLSLRDRIARENSR
jgi:hypothetical protein